MAVRATIVAPDGREHVRTARNKRELDRILRELTEWNRDERHRFSHVPLYASGVRYGREVAGSERWLTIPHLYARGVGDCEDLAAARAAEIPGARAVAIKTPMGWHVIVRLPDGSTEDPSERLGM